MNPRLHPASAFRTTFLVGLLAAPVATAAENISFEQHIRPILKTYCLDCHGGGETVKGKLDLRLRRFSVKGGDSRFPHALHSEGFDKAAGSPYFSVKACHRADRKSVEYYETAAAEQRVNQLHRPRPRTTDSRYVPHRRVEVRVNDPPAQAGPNHFLLHRTQCQWAKVPD